MSEEAMRNAMPDKEFRFISRDRAPKRLKDWTDADWAASRAFDEQLRAQSRFLAKLAERAMRGRGPAEKSKGGDHR